MTRAYLRLDPAFDEHKATYPDGPYAALVACLCLAEMQPQRGRFRNEKYLRALMGQRGRHLKYLLEHGDLMMLADGRLYIDGWDEWQEGDFTVHDRLANIRTRHGEGSPVSGAERTARWRERNKMKESDDVRDVTVTRHNVTVDRLDSAGVALTKRSADNGDAGRDAEPSLKQRVGWQSDKKP